MNILKKLLLCFLAAVMIFGLFACSEQPADPTDPTPNQPSATDPADDPTDPTDDGKVTYTVTVVDEAGKPIPGAVVQLCKDTCLPVVADQNGVATWHLAEDAYKVSFVMLPTGYAIAGDATEFYFEEGSREMTITLKAQ